MDSSVKGLGGRVFQGIVTVVLIALALCALMPFLLLVSSSFSDEATLFRQGYGFWPKGFTVYAYEYLFHTAYKSIARAFFMSFAVTVCGTLLHLLLAPMLAYPLSRPDYPRARIVTFLLFFTMLFSGGMVGNYLMWTNLFRIKNTFWALIFPGGMVLNAFTVILYKNSMATNIHPALIEAARIDGAGEFLVYFRIVLPLSMPILAAVGLMTAISYWNDWICGQYYITDKNLYSLQVMLNKILQNLQVILSLGGIGGVSAAQLPSVSIRMAIAVIGALPIVLLYPFFQKAFASGIALGGVKE
jgi:putative aldouronate transport system permease protein